MNDALPPKWREFLAGSAAETLWQKPLEAVARRRLETTVFPPAGALFHAFELTPPDAVKVVIMGQDPYHDDGQAQGLAFSVPAHVKVPPSLRNIFKEYADDLKRPVPHAGNLEAWAKGGVLLLNATLSVDAHQPGSHRVFGWEKFTDAVISALSRRKTPCVFILWGNDARNKAELIDTSRHLILQSAHPSPLSARHGFFGSHPFSAAEKFLKPWHWPELENEEELF